jgi:endonuclease/exonuclease/phosphatase (EEP) superfamily protein YafD
VVSGAALGVAWAVIGVLWAVTLARLVAWDRWEVFAVLDALTLVLFLPAWPIALVALWRRRWVLAGASVVMAITQVVLVTPELSAASPLPGNLHPVATVRLFDANVYDRNPSMAGYAAEIRRDRPDLVTLEEASPFQVDQLTRFGALDHLPYEFWNDAFGSRSIVVFSRYPLGPTVSSSVDGQPYLVRTTVEIPRRSLALWVVHTTSAIAPGVKPWNDELDGADRLLCQVRPHPLLMVGDFNSTWGNRGFRAILATGLVDGAAARGEALDMTWSQLTSPLPPLIRIDHVLTGPDVVVTSIHAVPGPGSDHRALEASVALTRSTR